jgi:hypothetical protein
MTAIATEHLRELAAGRSEAYELLLALEENPQADEACFRSLGQIVDWIVSHPISPEGGALDDLAAFVKCETQDLASTLPVLALALSEAGNPSRMRMLLINYPKWLRMASAVARPYFLGILPNIAAHVSEMEGDGVDALIRCLNTCTTAEDCEILAGCVDRYQETSGSIILAAAEIAGVAIRTNARPLVEKLMTVVTPDEIRVSRPTRELVPALVKIRIAVAGDYAIRESTWGAAVALCVAVAENNHSSALHLARHLERSLITMTPETQLAYLSSFQNIVEAAGVSMLGYGTKQLRGLFLEVGDERASLFVAQGVAIARRYGKVAGEEFFEQRSDASREASPLAGQASTGTPAAI